MNKKLAIIVLLSILLTSMGCVSFGEAMPFKDIENSYAKMEIETLYKDGVMTGKGEGIFKPKDKMTRAELAAVLARSLNLKEDVEAAKPFKDVSQDQWYAGYVGALVKAGITDGTSATTFSPNKNVSRQELAVFFIRAMGLEDSAKELKFDSNFVDKDEIDNWANDHVGLASKIGFISGMKNPDESMKFEPKSLAERQVLAIVTYKFNYNKNSYLDYIKDINKVEEPKPVDSVKPVEPTNPVNPTNLTNPTNPSQPTEPTNSTNPTKQVNLPKDDSKEDIKLKNITGRKKSFMGTYLMSIEFDVEGNVGNKEVKVVVNEGISDETILKQGSPKEYDFYYDGMVLSIDSINVYIDDEKIDINDMVEWQ